MYDLPRDELASYAPDLARPADLTDFWAQTLAASRAAARPPDFRPVETGLRLVRTFDITFSGSGGDPVRGWLRLPAQVDGPLPVVVRYQGYGGGRGLAHEAGFWPLAGYACLDMDTRGQGSGWSPGDTPDPAGSGPAGPGYMTRGILDPQDYYYRRVFTDGVLAVDAVRQHPDVDGSRVAVTGRSQGGGISLAVAALVPDLVAVMPDVPFLCHFRRATEVTDADPYGEIGRYLRVHRDHLEQVFRTLSYFDGAVLGALATAPALFSVALMDQICPPSTVFAAYHEYRGAAKELREYPYNDHEGGQGFQEAAQIAWLGGLLGTSG